LIPDIPDGEHEGRTSKAVKFLAAAAVVALAVRTAYLFVLYILGSTTTHRFHVESAALIFVGCGLVFRLRRGGRSEREPMHSSAFSSWTWFLFCALAIALYWPALSVGFLSDDFVLVNHASSWRIGPVTPALFRPLPLVIWALLLHAGAGAKTLHLLNVVLHGTNAYLTARVVERWVQDRKWSLLAGLLVLTAPLAPEAVAWCSGVFDLFATSLVLTCVLVARRYEDHPSMATRIQFVAVGIGALASKETAAIAVGLVLAEAWSRDAISRRLLVDTGILVGIVGVFSLARLTSAFGLARLPFSKYLLQRAVFGSFGGLAVPWHVDVIRRLPWLPILGVLIVIYLSAVFLVEPGSKRRTKLASAAALWLLLPIIPIWPIFFVAPDLQASRFLYLPVVGWAALVVVVASEPSRKYLKLLSTAAVVGLILIAAYGTVLHLRPWKEAARLRDQVEASALDVGMNRCPTITLSDLPDSVRGAYVFRNGGREAFASDLHLNAIVDNQSVGPCSFRWSDARLSFMQSRSPQ
jgi:hypothetical protein